MRKLLIICGPTATGKTALAEKLAKKFNGEIVSADSRLVYKGLDIITGKDVPKDIPIHLIDIVEPDYIFNVGEYFNLALRVINKINASGKLPILVGGTGLYIRSIIRPLNKINIPPNEKLRKELEKLSREDLIEKLKNINPQKWQSMNNSDKQNPRRLIRAVEIFLSRQKREKTDYPEFDYLIIGLSAKKETLKKIIDQRVEERIRKGAADEAKNVLKKYNNPKLPAISSTGLRQLKEYFKGKESWEIAVNKWKLAEYQYAKRQLTWFKKEKDINWFDVENANFNFRIEALVLKWYTP